MMRVKIIIDAEMDLDDDTEQQFKNLKLEPGAEIDFLDDRLHSGQGVAVQYYNLEYVILSAFAHDFKAEVEARTAREEEDGLLGEWHVSAVNKNDPKLAMGFISKEEPTEAEIADWREWHYLDDSWEVRVSHQEG